MNKWMPILLRIRGVVSTDILIDRSIVWETVFPPLGSCHHPMGLEPQTVNNEPRTETALTPAHPFQLVCAVV